MVEIDPGLDTRLRAFFDHYEAEAMPSRLATFDEEAKPKGRTVMQFAAGAIGVAVIAAAVAVFAIELRSHDNSAPSPAATSSSVGSSLPSASQMTAPLPSSAHTVVPVRRGQGDATLRRFTPKGLIFIEYACVGDGYLKIGATNDPQMADSVADGIPCSGVGTDAPVTGTIFPAMPLGTEPLSFTVTAGPTTTWEIVVADGGPVPPLADLTLATPTDSHVLTDAEYGTGTGDVTSMFSPTGPVNVLYACTGSGSINIDASNSAEQIDTHNACSEGAVGSAVLSVPPLKGPVRISVTGGSKTLWEVIAYEYPGPKRS